MTGDQKHTDHIETGQRVIRHSSRPNVFLFFFIVLLKAHAQIINKKNDIGDILSRFSEDKDKNKNKLLNCFSRSCKKILFIFIDFYSDNKYVSAHDDENICRWSLDGSFLGENPTTIKAVNSILTLNDFNKSVIFL